MLEEWFQFLMILKPKVNYAQKVVSWFNEFETKKKVYPKWLPSMGDFPT